MKDNFFDFIESKKTAGETTPEETATSGNLVKKKKKARSNGPSPVTNEIRAEAKKLAESSTGLDIAAFQRKYNLQVMNIDEILRG